MIRAHRLELPETGSDLAIDDAIFPHMAISQLARMSLVLAGEHLRLAFDAIQAKQPYPSSHFTVPLGHARDQSQATAHHRRRQLTYDRTTPPPTVRAYQTSNSAPGVA